MNKDYFSMFLWVTTFLSFHSFMKKDYSLDSLVYWIDIDAKLEDLNAKMAETMQGVKEVLNKQCTVSKGFRRLVG